MVKSAVRSAVLTFKTRRLEATKGFHIQTTKHLLQHLDELQAYIFMLLKYKNVHKTTISCNISFSEMFLVDVETVTDP